MDDFTRFLRNVRVALRFALTDKSTFDLSEEGWDRAIGNIYNILGRFPEETERLTYVVIFALPYPDGTQSKFVWKLSELLNKEDLL